MKKTLFLTAVLTAAIFATQAEAETKTINTTDTDPLTLSDGDVLKMDITETGISDNKYAYSADITIDGSTSIRPSDWKASAATFSGQINGSGTLRLDSEVGSSYISDYVLTNSESNFSGVIELNRTGRWGASGNTQLVLNGTGEALANASVNVNGHKLVLAQNASLSTVTGSGAIYSTQASNTLTLCGATNATFSGTVGKGDGNVYNNWETYSTTDANQKANAATTSLALVKSGTGQQTFTGEVALSSLAVNNGTLTFNNKLSADSVTVQSGSTLELNRSGSNRTLNTDAINTTLGDTTISGGQIKITEGSVSMSSLAVASDATASIYFQNAKDITLGKLTGGTGATLTIQRRDGDTNAIDFVQIKGDDSNYSGTITMQHDGSSSNNGANMLVVSAADALKAAKVDLQGPSEGSNVLSLNVTEASLRSLAGSSANAKVEVCSLTGNAGVSAATLTITGADNATFSGTIADNVTLKIAAGASQTLGAATVSKITNSGTLKITEDSLTLSTLTLTSNSLIQVMEDHSGTLTTSALTVSGTGAKMYANLVMNSGTLTFADNSILTMGCDVTIGNAVTVELTDAMVQSIMNGNDVEIITGVDRADLGQSLTFIGSGTMRDYVAAHESVYSLKQVGDKIYITPEPATATLSLLALAGLASRRRRK